MTTRLNELYSKKQELARELARHAHDDEGQLRKGTGDRYWVHTQGVADLIEGYDADEDECISAELHDTREDTQLPLETIEEMFGSKVAEIVTELTNDDDEIAELEKKYKGQNFSKQLAKEEYMNAHLMNMSGSALTVKLGDMLYNLLDRPGEQQAKRMMNTVNYLIKHGKIKKGVHRELVNAFITGYDSKFDNGYFKKS